ncbi:hypothetical protein EVG20_g7925 [Dentipellis fragilis]|uniref:Fungal-type protein kinase domain-containing protein n=1 Tax=Dentipellis fragilis TaxID=205917 RepID=A0A4Y9YA23_9AGAM|nr:hypothetical protein EVG20_g7925 [Dentipellis fragilis]
MVLYYIRTTLDEFWRESFPPTWPILGARKSNTPHASAGIHEPTVDLADKLHSIGDFDAVPWQASPDNARVVDYYSPIVSNDTPPERLDAHAIVSLSSKCRVVNRMFHEVGLHEYALICMATGRASENGPDPDDCTGPDLALYRAQNESAYMPLSDGALPMATDDEPQNPDRGPGHPTSEYDARTAWAWMLSLVTVTADRASEPFAQFCTSKLALEVNENESSPARREMLRCAAEVQLRQHRVFVLGACIHRRHVRFVRWDRAGVLVSDPVDYVDDPEMLLRFFWADVDLLVALRAGMDVDMDEQSATESGLGLGPELGPDAAMRGAQKTGAMWQRRYLDEVLDNQQSYPIYKITCDDAPGCDVPDIPNRTFTYLIGKHTAGTISPTGRCTKGYVALDVDRNSLVFVKGFWCSRAPGVRRELEIYKVLKDKGVEHVATALAGGDVGGHEGQLTITQDFIEDQSKSPSRAARFHYRVVLQQVGRPLETYESHYEAWTKAEILHRDVSDNKILIDVRTGRGFLNDWDLCKFKSELQEGATQYDERVDTWMYMSSSLLHFPKKPNQLSDDLESFQRRMTQMVTIINTKTMHRNADLASHLDVTYLKTFATQDGYSIGSKEKCGNLRIGTPDVTFHHRSLPLAKIIAELYPIFRPFYEALDVGEYNALYSPHIRTLRLAAAPLSRGELMRTIFQNPAPDDSDTPQPSSAPPCPPTPPLPRGLPFDLKDMNHEHLMPAWRMLSGMMEWPPASEKTVDQFKGLQAAPGPYLPGVSRYYSQRRSLLFKLTRLPTSREQTVDSLNDE